MSISSVGPPVPMALSSAGTEAQTPQVKADTTPQDENAHKPPALSPLPPGQGTRVDQLV